MGKKIEETLGDHFPRNAAGATGIVTFVVTWGAGTALFGSQALFVFGTASLAYGATYAISSVFQYACGPTIDKLSSGKYLKS